jgi:hypothetical protein
MEKLIRKIKKATLILNTLNQLKPTNFQKLYKYKNPTLEKSTDVSIQFNFHVLILTQLFTIYNLTGSFR